jgi:hypothetical protein
MQKGILVSQTKDSGNYRVVSLSTMAAVDGSEIDCNRLSNAWKKVVRRHALLRAVVVDNMPGNHELANIILRDPQPEILILQTKGESMSLDEFQKHYDATTQQHLGGLQHHLALCQLKDGTVAVCLSINHAIIDAHSRDILLEDLKHAYVQKLDGEAPSFRNVSVFFEQQVHEEAKKYWAGALEAAEPCLFPELSETPDHDVRERSAEVVGLDVDAIHAFCQQWEVTLSTIIQVAWALVLKDYTGCQSPCFGNLTSGRDLDIDQVNEIFGPLINIFTSRIQLDATKTILDTIRSAHETYVESIPYQSYPLIDIHRSLGLNQMALFNTGISLTRSDSNEEEEDSNLLVVPQDWSDPTEVSGRRRGFYYTS